MRTPLILTSVALASLASPWACSLLVKTDGLAEPSAVIDGSPEGSIDAGADAPISAAPRAWSRVPVTGPSPRHSTTMAFDAARHHVVLFGGVDQNVKKLGDTWTWDGATWTDAKPSGSPPARFGGRLAFDADRNVIVLAGGTGGPIGNEVWEWDGGSTWIQKASSSGKRPLAHAAVSFAYDSEHKKSVLFGGTSQDGGLQADTWEWGSTAAGLDWTQRAPAMRPNARTGAAAAYDSRRKRMVLFGGRATDNTTSGETWEFDGNEWEKRQPQSIVPVRVGACIAFDESRGVTVLYGGSGPSGPKTLLNDTWLWDGNDWSPGPAGPPGSRACAMAYDRDHDAVVLFGGTTADESSVRTVVGETWLLK